MKLVCYFAAAEGSHPHCTTAEYDRIWPVMANTVKRLGYELIHLTSQEDRARCDTTIRYDIDPKAVMYSREIAWAKFLESLPDGETACMVEPDAMLLRKIPRLIDDCDMMLLRRPERSLPSGFRLAKKTALPFYQAVIDLYSTYTPEEKVFHGDVRAHHAILGLGKDGANLKHPHKWNNVKIEVRHWMFYTSKLWSNAVAWNFKGTSKQCMLDISDGKKVMTR